MSTLAVSTKHLAQLSQLSLSPRLLLGAGPSNCHPRVLQALALPTIGHVDPEYTAVMNDIRKLLKYVMQTDNETTLTMSGTGHFGWESLCANLIEKGDNVLIAVSGFFSERWCDMSSRYGAHVIRLEKEWGEGFSVDELVGAIEQHKPQLFCLVHAETSTGVMAPISSKVGEACHKHGGLFLLDTVTSLGGAPVFIDEWGVDATYSCSQKGLAAPPGLSPVTFSERALQKIQRRKEKVIPFSVDIPLISQYWGINTTTRSYHHTSPVNMNYAFRESLKLIAEEGLENVWQRHHSNAQILWKGLEKLGLELLVKDEALRLPTLTTVKVPEKFDGKKVADRLLKDFNIEISGSLGAKLAGKIWRIGLMGFNSRRENVYGLLKALEVVLGDDQCLKN